MPSSDPDGCRTGVDWRQTLSTASSPATGPGLVDVLTQGTLGGDGLGGGDVGAAVGDATSTSSRGGLSGAVVGDCGDKACNDDDDEGLLPAPAGGRGRGGLGGNGGGTFGDVGDRTPPFPTQD